MEIFSSLLLVILTSYLFYKKISYINPLFVFVGLWTFVIGCYSLHLFGLYKARPDMFFVMISGIIMFICGVLMIHFMYKHNIFAKFINSKKQYVLRDKIFLLFGIICILYFSRKFLISMLLIFQGNSLENIRNIAQDSSSILNQTNPIMNLIQNFIILPFATAIEVIGVVEFWNGKKKSPIFLINLIILIMRVITDGGRTPLVNFCLYMICGYFLFHKSENKHSDKSIRRFSIVGFFLLLITSLARSGLLLLRHIYLYFSMSPYLFSFWCQQTEIRNVYGYGTTSLNGFIFPLAYFKKNVTRGSYPDFISTIYDLIAETDSTWVQILPGHTEANAYVSAMWFFYVDGRILGVIVGMFLYGMLISFSYVLATRTTSIKAKACYLLLLQGLIFSFIRFPFAKIYYSLALIIILFIAYKKNNKAY